MNILNIRLITLLISLAALSCPSHSQDLIVLRSGDSLNCAIKEMGPKKVKICNIINGRKVYSDITTTDIKVFTYGYYKDQNENNSLQTNQLSNVRLSFNGGLSYRIGPVNDDVPDIAKDYMEELKSGYCYSADLRFFFNKHLGLGGKYFVHRSVFEDNISGYGAMKDDIKISYAGPMFTARFPSQLNSNAIILDAGFGYLSYHDEGYVQNIDGKIKGETLGYSLSAGYDIGFGKNIGIGFQIAIISGVLSEYDLTLNGKTETVELDENSYENLTHINFSIGLWFNLD